MTRVPYQLFTEDVGIKSVSRSSSCNSTSSSSATTNTSSGSGIQYDTLKACIETIDDMRLPKPPKISKLKRIPAPPTLGETIPWLRRVRHRVPRVQKAFEYDVRNDVHNARKVQRTSDEVQNEGTEIQKAADSTKNPGGPKPSTSNEAHVKFNVIASPGLLTVDSSMKPSSSYDESSLSELAYNSDSLQRLVEASTTSVGSSASASKLVIGTPLISPTPEHKEKQLPTPTPDQDDQEPPKLDDQEPPKLDDQEPPKLDDQEEPPEQDDQEEPPKLDDQEEPPEQDDQEEPPMPFTSPSVLSLATPRSLVKRLPKACLTPTCSGWVLYVLYLFFYAVILSVLHLGTLYVSLTIFLTLIDKDIDVYPLSHTFNMTRTRDPPIPFLPDKK